MLLLKVVWAGQLQAGGTQEPGFHLSLTRHNLLGQLRSLGEVLSYLLGVFQVVLCV